MKLLILDGIHSNVKQREILDQFSKREPSYSYFHFNLPPDNVSDQMEYQYDITFPRNLEHTSKQYEMGVPAFWNNSHISEYVNSVYFRKVDPQEAQKKLIEFEKKIIHTIPIEDVHLVCLSVNKNYLNESNEYLFNVPLDVTEKRKLIDMYEYVVNNISILKNKFYHNIDLENGKLENTETIIQEILTKFKLPNI